MYTGNTSTFNMKVNLSTEVPQSTLHIMFLSLFQLTQIAMQSELSSCEKNKSRIPRKTFQDVVGSGASASDDPPFGNPGDPDSQNRAFPVSAKVKTKTERSSVPAGQDDLGEHAVGMPRAPPLKYSRGPK